MKIKRRSKIRLITAIVLVVALAVPVLSATPALAASPPVYESFTTAVNSSNSATSLTITKPGYRRWRLTDCCGVAQ